MIEQLSLLPPEPPRCATCKPIRAHGKDRSFTPWNGRTGEIRSTTPAGIALIDFGLGPLYPCPTENLLYERP